MQIIMFILILLNFWILGVSRIKTAIKILLFQGILIGIIPMWHGEIELIVLGAVIIVLKAIVFPRLLLKTARKVNSTTEEKPYISFALSPLWGTALLMSAYMITPAYTTSVFMIIVGLFLIITRRKAINQIVSFLVFENGIYLFGFTFAAKIPIVMEMAIILDVLALVLVMGISIEQMNKQFTHTDVDKLNSLKG